jgi:hypothetical protein
MWILVPEWHCDLHDTPKTVNALYCEASIKGIVCILMEIASGGGDHLSTWWSKLKPLFLNSWFELKMFQKGASYDWIYMNCVTFTLFLSAAMLKVYM